MSELADATDVGPGFGADVALWLNDHVGLAIDGNIDLLRGEDRYGMSMPGANETGGVY